MGHRTRKYTTHMVYLRVHGHGMGQGSADTQKYTPCRRIFVCWRWGGSARQRVVFQSSGRAGQVGRKGVEVREGGGQVAGSPSISRFEQGRVLRL